RRLGRQDGAGPQVEVLGLDLKMAGLFLGLRLGGTRADCVRAGRPPRRGRAAALARRGAELRGNHHAPPAGRRARRPGHNVLAGAGRSGGAGGRGRPGGAGLWSGRAPTPGSRRGRRPRSPMDPPPHSTHGAPVSSWTPTWTVIPSTCATAPATLRTSPCGTSP